MIKMSKERTVIVVSRKGEFSVHGSFTKACKSYGWDRSGFRMVPDSHKGYSVRKISMEVTIDCLMLMEFACQNDTAIRYENNYKANETFLIEFCGRKTSYGVEVSIKMELEEAWDNGNDGGFNNTGGGYYHFVPQEVLKVLDEDGDKMNVDETTKEFLLDLINIEETENHED